MPEIWAGVDIGKEHHHCVVIDTDGERLLSRRVLNDETELLQLIADVLAISTDVLWAVDLNHGGAALLIGLLLSHDQPMAYLTGLAVHRASATYRGEGKTDAKDAFVIADQARMRKDLGLLRPGDEIAVDLRTLTDTAHRPGLRPHPADQPSPGPTAGDFPCIGAVAGARSTRGRSCC